MRYQEAMRDCAVEGPDEIGHFKGACSNNCRRCQLEEDLERDAQVRPDVLSRLSTPALIVVIDHSS